MLMYIGIIYAFFGDMFIFKETFNGFELLGTGVVCFFTIGMLIYTNFFMVKKPVPAPAKTDDDFVKSK